MSGRGGIYKGPNGETLHGDGTQVGKPIDRPVEKVVDIVIQNEGTIFLFHPLTTKGKEWLVANVQDDARWFGKALVVEHRYAMELARGAVEDGGLRIK